VFDGEKVPVPEVVHIPDPVVLVPPTTTTALFAHTVWSGVVVTLGTGAKMISTVSSSARHVPLFPDVSTKSTCPAVVSDVLGTYVAFNVVLFGTNDPDPRVVHVPEPVDEVPFRTVFGEEIHVRIVSPATTNGASVNVTCNESVTALHNPFPVVVRYSVICPAAVSADDGTYVVDRAVLLGVNVPDPLVDHCPPVATETLPFRLMFELFPQTLTSAPAVAIGASVIVITN